MPLPDYSQWLTPPRLAEEERLWTTPGMATWPIFVDWIQRVLPSASQQTIIEFGCGTGLVPAALPGHVSYIGVDANRGCIERARTRNPFRHFVVGDVRTSLHLSAARMGRYGIACAFSFLKHFGLHEWDAVVSRVLHPGEFGLFAMPIGPEVKDDGTEFPHVWVNVARLDAAIENAGHRRVDHPGPLPWGECMIVTRRC